MGVVDCLFRKTTAVKIMTTNGPLIPIERESFYTQNS